jgi:hypothetical protein
VAALGRAVIRQFTIYFFLAFALTIFINAEDAAARIQDETENSDVRALGNSLVRISIRGDGTVTSFPSGIDCSSSQCEVSVGTGRVFMLVGSPGENGSSPVWLNQCNSPFPFLCFIRVKDGLSVNVSFGQEGRSQSIQHDIALVLPVTTSDDPTQQSSAGAYGDYVTSMVDNHMGGLSPTAPIRAINGAPVISYANRLSLREPRDTPSADRRMVPFWGAELGGAGNECRYNNRYRIHDCLHGLGTTFPFAHPSQSDGYISYDNHPGVDFVSGASCVGGYCLVHEGGSEAVLARAAAPGVIEFVYFECRRGEWNICQDSNNNPDEYIRGLGNQIHVRHDNGWVTVYGHLTSLAELEEHFPDRARVANSRIAAEIRSYQSSADNCNALSQQAVGDLVESPNSLVGLCVDSGDAIGVIGGTSGSRQRNPDTDELEPVVFGPHLHFEVHVELDRYIVDPYWGVVICGLNPSDRADCNAGDAGAPIRASLANDLWDDAANCYETPCGPEALNTAGIDRPAATSHTVSVATSSGGSVFAQIGSIRCGPNTSGNCSSQFTEGVSVTLIAAPQDDNVFTGWSGDCASISGRYCVVSVNGASSVSAGFGPQANWLSAPAFSSPANMADRVALAPEIAWSSVSGASHYWLTVAPSPLLLPDHPSDLRCPGCVISAVVDVPNHLAGNAAQLDRGRTASLEYGQTYYAQVQGFVDGGRDGRWSDIIEFTVAESTTYFPVSVSVTGNGVIASDGAISCPGAVCGTTIRENDEIYLFTRPDAGNEFAGWGGDCAAWGTSSDCVVRVDGPQFVTAHFRSTGSQTGSITTYLAPESAVQDGAAWRIEGETSWRSSGTTATGVALGDHVLEFRSLDGWVTPPDFELTLTEGARDRDVHWDYQRPDKSVHITFSGDGRGETTISGEVVSCSQDCSIDVGNAVHRRIHARPSAGSLFGGWTGDCVDTSETADEYWCDVEFLEEAGDRNVGVQFDVNPDADRHSLTIVLNAFDGLGEGRIVSDTHPEINCVDRCTYEIVEGLPLNIRLELEDSVLVQQYVQGQGWAIWFNGNGYNQNPQLNRDETYIFDLAAASSRWVQSYTDSFGNGRFQVSPPLRFSTDQIGDSCSEEDFACRDVLPTGQTIAVTAIPSADWVLYSWLGELGAQCPDNQNPCELTLEESDDPLFLNARFSPVISASTSGTGSGRVIAGPTDLTCTTTECRSQFIDCGPDCVEIRNPDNSTYAFYALPDPDSEFVGWNRGCGNGEFEDACYVGVQSPVHVAAEFSRIVVDNTLTVARSGTGSGGVTSDPAGINCGTTCEADFPDTATVALTANAEAGSVFAGWTGECASTDGNICNADMSSDRSVEAVFNLEPVTISYFARGQGTGAVSSDPAGMNCADDCASEFAPGTTVTFTANAADGSVFGGWGGLCSGEALTCQRTLNADSEVWARFNLAAPPTSRIVSSIVPQSRGGPTGGTLTAFMGVTNAGEEIATECRPALRTEAGIDFSFVAIDDDQTGNPIAPDDYPVDVPPNRGDPQEFLVRFTSASAVGPVAARVLVLCSNSTTRFTPSVNTIVLTFEDTPPADIVATISTTTNNGRVEIPDGRNNGVLAGAAINVTGRDFGIPATIRVVPNTAEIPLGVTLEICETDASAACLPGSPLSDTVDVTMGADPVFLKVVLRRVPGAGVPFIPAFIRAVLDFYQVDDQGNVDPDAGLRGRTSVGLDISAPDAIGIDGLWSGIARLLDDPDDVPSPVLLAIDGDTAWMMVGDSTEVIATGVQTFPEGGFVLDLETAAGSHVGVGGAFTPRHQILADSFELRQTNLRFAFVDPRMTAPALPTGNMIAARLDLASRTLDGNDAMALNRSGSGSPFSGNYGDCAVTLSDGTWNALRMIHSSLILSGCTDAGSYPALIVPLLPFTGQDGILIIVSGSGFSGAWGIAE